MDVERTSSNFDALESGVCQQGLQLFGFAQRERNIDLGHGNVQVPRGGLEQGFVQGMELQVLPNAEDGTPIRRKNGLDPAGSRRPVGKELQPLLAQDEIE